MSLILNLNKESQLHNNNNSEMTQPSHQTTLYNFLWWSSTNMAEEWMAVSIITLEDGIILPNCCNNVEIELMRQRGEMCRKAER